MQGISGGWIINLSNMAEKKQPTYEVDDDQDLCLEKLV